MIETKKSKWQLLPSLKKGNGEGVEAVTRQLLFNRGLKDGEVDEFLNPEYEKLHDPYLFNDMKKVVARIKKAVKNQEKVYIYGDYDIDGMTASAQLYETITAAGGLCEIYIPNRFDEGYGLNSEAVKRLTTEGAKLIITVDCGITGLAEVDLANEKGVDVIITDHHILPSKLPKAYAILHPLRDGEKYPFRWLSGSGVAFKLACALHQEFRLPKGHEKWLLDLAALGTISDMVSLKGENRIIAQYGLLVLSKTRRPGLKALYRQAGIEGKQISTYELGFVIGPRLNASGRLEHARKSLELLITQDKAHAANLAEELNNLNTQRQFLTQKIFGEAKEVIQNGPESPLLMVCGDGWNHGVVGIVASRLTNHFGKPAIVLGRKGDEIKGSARSVGEFNIVEALSECKDCLVVYGGHQMAAGLTVKADQLEALRHKLYNIASSKQKDLESVRPIEAELPIDLVGDELWQALTKLGPHGVDNPLPIFVSDVMVLEIRAVGKDATHLKLRISNPQDQSQYFEAIGFGLLPDYGDVHPGDIIKLIYSLDQNEWNGRVSLQLKVSDISNVKKPAQAI